MNKLIQTLCGLGMLLAALPTSATNGYFPHGYGLKGKGMAGVSTALAQDSFGGANNPASMVWVGNRLDLGLEWFRPTRGAERSGAGFPTLTGSVESGKPNFFIPEAGFNYMLRSDLSLGVTVYGNGGMNTDYPQGSFDCGGGPANMLCGAGRLGVDLIQLVVAPTVAYKLNAQHSVGASLLLGYQQFKANGLQAFDNPPGFPPFTGAPGSVTNNGYDSASGTGVRVGWQGRVSDMVTLGASYSTKIRMGRFNKYRGLFAQNGDFDIPANYSLGVAFMPNPRWTYAADFSRIEYSKIQAVGNSSSIPLPLGSEGGPGFGWRDVSVIKLGVAYQFNDSLILRAGFNRGTNPVRPEAVTFNIVAPGVPRNHVTLGFTYAPDKDNEITGAFMVAPRESVSGASPLFGGTEKLSMRQMSIGLAWARKF